jgi:hypothetical protein
MDHHDDWSHFPEDDSGLGDHDTADLGGPDHLGGEHHVNGFDEHDGGYDDPGAHTPPPDLSHGPDLLHESGDYDVPDHTDVPDHADVADHDAGQPDHYGPPDHYDEPEHHAGAGEHIVGVDPDLPADHDGHWHEGHFPPVLELDTRPEPADGYPWADPDTLGDPGTHADADHYGLALGAGAPAGDLFAYAGLDAAPAGVDPWSLLLGSDDPATSTLARWWGPA